MGRNGRFVITHSILFRSLLFRTIRSSLRDETRVNTSRWRGVGANPQHSAPTP